LVAGVEAAVAGGQLRPGEQLPSVRRLASDIGLSPATVASGLAELRRRGVIITESRRGSRVGDGRASPAWLAAPPVPAGARDVSRGNPDPELLPDLAGALARCEQPTRLYGEAAELPELVAQARAQLQADGIPGEELCVLSGALDCIDRVLDARLRAGDRVAVEDPGYPALYDLLRAKGMTLMPVAIDGRGMRAEALGAALQAGAVGAVVTPRGQNPTGAALDAGRARELRGVFAEHREVLVIEDDHLGPVAGHELHTLAAATDRWAATRSVAKALGPDLRLAVLAGDETTLARVRVRQLCGPGWVSHVLQRLVHELWLDEDVRGLIERAEETYTRRRLRLLDELAARGIAAEAASGLNVWIEVADEAAAITALLARGWVVAAGARFRLASRTPAIRVTTASLGEQECGRFAADLAFALEPAALSRSG
jgi:DNA-binding transcriptional MocR family regulator